MRLSKEERRELEILAECPDGFGWFVNQADYALGRPLGAGLVDVGRGMIWITPAGRAALSLATGGRNEQ